MEGVYEKGNYPLGERKGEDGVFIRGLNPLTERKGKKVFIRRVYTLWGKGMGGRYFSQVTDHHLVRSVSVTKLFTIWRTVGVGR